MAQSCGSLAAGMGTAPLGWGTAFPQTVDGLRSNGIAMCAQRREKGTKIETWERVILDYRGLQWSRV